MVHPQPEAIINKKNIYKIIDALLRYYAIHTILCATIYSKCPKSNTLK